MKKAIVVEQSDIKRILAEHFEVPDANVMKSQYSYTVIIERSESDESNKSLDTEATGA